MKLDCIIIAPGNQRQVYQDLAEDFTAIEPPIWARLIASYLERKGASVEIVDQSALNESAEYVARYVTGRAWLIIIVAHGQQPSASTQLMPEVKKICTNIKLGKAIQPVLIVGGHPAALPERTLQEGGRYAADFVCTGEGPVTAWEALQLVKGDYDGKWRQRWGDINDVSGMVWSAPGLGPVKTVSAENIWDLSEMFGNQWNKLPMSKYRAHNWHCFQEKSRQPYASIYTSLGCPFSCGFCMIQTPFKEGDWLKYEGKANSYRTWKTEDTMAELDILVEDYGVTNIKIADEMFVLKPNHFLPLCKAITERWGDKLNFWAYARVDTCKPEYLDTLRAAGVKWLCLGIESASNAQRDGVEKADYSETDILATTDQIWDSGINLIANFIYGLPDDNEVSLSRTEDLIFEIAPEFLNLYCAVAYPGTKLYEYAQAVGWKLPDNWSGYSHHAYDYQPLPTKHLTAEQVLRARDATFEKYYNASSTLMNLKAQFGEKVVEQVKAMTAVKLRRKLLGD